MNEKEFNMRDYVNNMFRIIISANMAGYEMLNQYKKEKEMQTNQEEIQEQRTFSDMYYLNATETVVPEKLLWAKRVIGVNKYRANKNTMQTDENNFTGPYINIDVPEDWQEGDIYLACSLYGPYTNEKKVYSMFQFTDGRMHPIAKIDETYDWPTLLFSTVEHLLEKK